MDKDVAKALKDIQKQLDVLKKPNPQQLANRKYRQSLKAFSLRFKNDEKNLWDYVQSKQNSTKYIKDLIIEDMKKNGAL